MDGTRINIADVDPDWAANNPDHENVPADDPRRAPIAKDTDGNLRPKERGRRFGRLLVLGPDDIDTAAPRDYLLKGIISPAEMSVWVGAPKSGKSFLLLHVAYMLSLGRQVFGRRVKPTTVIYVAAEGEAGIANRIKALRDKYGISPRFYFIAQPADLLTEAGHLDELVEAASAILPKPAKAGDPVHGLIVLDTLSRLMAGGDENSPVDMGTFIRNVSELRHETGAHVAIVHHGTKATNGTTPRGHGALTGADDALVEVAKHDDGSRTATVVHAKDDADGARHGFAMDVVELGIDGDGDPITTLTVRETEVQAADKATGPRLSPNEAAAFRCLQDAIRAEGQDIPNSGGFGAQGVHVETWRQWFYTKGLPGHEPEARQKAFKRSVAALLEKERIGSDDGYVWLQGR